MGRISFDTAWFLDKWREAGVKCEARMVMGEAGIDYARNVARSIFLNHKETFDYLLFCDDDVVPPVNIWRMCQGGYDVVAACCPQWTGSEFYYGSFKRVGDEYLPDDRVFLSQIPFETDGVSTACCAIHRRVLEKVFPFKVSFTEDGEWAMGEDFNYCASAIMNGFSVWTDPRFWASHLKQINLLDVVKWHRASS